MKDQLISLKVIEPIVIMLNTAINIKPTTGVLLVAPPGSGKSALIRQIKGKGILIVDDLTAKSIDTLIEENRGVRLIGISDMNTVLARTSQSSPLNVMLNLTEEGYLGTLRYKSINTKEKTFITFVGGITTDRFQDVKKKLKDTGLLSRMILIHYSYTPEEQEEILKEIKDRRVNLENVDLRIELRDNIVLKELSPEASRYIDNHILPLFKGDGAIRQFKRFLNFAKTLGTLYGVENEITDRDVAFASALLETYSSYITPGTYSKFINNLRKWYLKTKGGRTWQ